MKKRRWNSIPVEIHSVANGVIREGAFLGLMSPSDHLALRNVSWNGLKPTASRDACRWQVLLGTSPGPFLTNLSPSGDIVLVPMNAEAVHLSKVLFRSGYRPDQGRGTPSDVNQMSLRT